MRGMILGVHEGRGVLIGAGEKRLDFPLSEWRSPGTPAPGQAVDYVEGESGARDVFAVPGANAPPIGGGPSGAMTLGAIAVGCFALGFIIPLVPTIAAFVLGVVGAARARDERDETALVLSRVAWIGALVMVGLGVLTLLGVLAIFGGLAGFGVWHHWD
ncbi:MAG TPA: hypothetical protein VG841_03475 [Caulobacterales bacterium]|nr:hypothetical protein [Caulobacterales bacterium]